MGLTITEDMHQAILQLPDRAWEPAYYADGQVRPGARATELTGLPDLSSRPGEMRVIVRKERAHPGAQLRFTDFAGHRFTASPPAAGRRAGQTAAHRGARRGARSIDVVAAEVALAGAIGRPWTYERGPRGTLGLIGDRHRGVLAGAWAVGPLASEWIHQAALAIRAQIPVDVLLDQVAQFPAYSDAYLAALSSPP